MEWISWVADPNVWASLVTLTFLEILLGIDNVIFISILAGKLPRPQQARARTLGLGLALVTRILLLVSIKPPCRPIFRLPTRIENNQSDGAEALLP
jgi:predicted tellurium resistance membrane protein TerC